MPCQCTHFTDKKETALGIHCDYKFIKIVPEIFESTTAVGFDHLWISNDQSGMKGIDKFVIPKDILANHWVTESIQFGRCDNCWKKPLLEIDPNAFRLSCNFTKLLLFRTIDMLKLNFSFLEGFNQLEKLHIYGCSNVHFLEFPLLPKLRELGIWDRCSWLKNWAFLQSRSSIGLEFAYLQNNFMSDSDVDQLLKWLLKGQTKDTLMTLYLQRNSLTRIPGQLKYFTNLQDIGLSYQNEPGFGVLSDPIFSNNTIANSFFGLSASHISYIKPGVFQGLFNIRKMSKYFQMLRYTIYK